ncbi:hypothetical protein NDU88_002481 [Pleurodeles waltl]|uniref:Uncharacterized protein n=1 Tax=Pleurodeles waltl TaxID=8319 RepID=A0AAV7W1Z5_PLEWA|nr:hypothetical protein NDU88_002481 [Pleurodeles waltl]
MFPCLSSARVFWIAPRGPLLVSPRGRIGGFIGPQAPLELKCGCQQLGLAGGATLVLHSAARPRGKAPCSLVGRGRMIAPVAVLRQAAGGVRVW